MLTTELSASSRLNVSPAGTVNELMFTVVHLTALETSDKDEIVPVQGVLALEASVLGAAAASCQALKRANIGIASVMVSKVTGVQNGGGGGECPCHCSGPSAGTFVLLQPFLHPEVEHHSHAEISAMCASAACHLLPSSLEVAASSAVKNFLAKSLGTSCSSTICLIYAPSVSGRVMMQSISEDVSAPRR